MTEGYAAWQRARIAVLVAVALVCAAAVAVVLGSAPPGRLVGGLFAAHSKQPLRLKPKQPARLPAPQLDKWRQFAAARSCSLDDRDYAQIWADLEPFRRAGGVTEADVAAAAAALPAATAVLEVRGGRALDEDEQGGAGPDGKPRRARRLPWGGLGWYHRLMEGFVSELPDLKVLVNFGDRPRSWSAPLLPAEEAAVRAGTLTVQAAWEAHACDAAVGAGMRRKHGLFQPGPFWGHRGPLPIISGWRVDGCFSDILAPHAWNNKGNATRLTLSSGCPLLHDTWANKSDTAFWRGSSTGARVTASMAPEEWSAFQRQRLVGLSRAHPAALDAAFTHFTQCDPEACAAMEAHYGAVPFADGPAQLFSHKYSVVVDGNGAAARLGPTLCSGSVALDAQVFREWYAFRLHPFTHFIPVRPDYDDLLQRIEWARKHDAEAQRIADNAVRFVNAHLRAEDMQCYMYRLLLEYGALYRPAATNTSDATDDSSSSRGGGGDTLARNRTAAAQERPP